MWQLSIHLLQNTSSENPVDEETYARRWIRRQNTMDENITHSS